MGVCTLLCWLTGKAGRSTKPWADAGGIFMPPRWQMTWSTATFELWAPASVGAD